MIARANDAAWHLDNPIKARLCAAESDIFGKQIGKTNLENITCYVFNKKDMMLMLPRALTFTPEYRDYIWGGHRLRPNMLTAEAWVIYENNRIDSGPLTGPTHGEVSARYREELLG